MTLTITIKCDNAAFDLDNGGPEQEVARILTTYAKRLNDGLVNIQFETKMGRAPELLRDINGNTVGKVEVSD